MKKNALHNTSYRYIIQSFKEWLDILGYADTTVYNLPIMVRECFSWLEARGKTTIDRITHNDIADYYDHLCSRPNQRRQGGLSNAYLNKHQQALKKLSEYLRKTGGTDLPIQEIGIEKVNREKIDVLTIKEIKAVFKATENFNTGITSEAYNARDRAMLTVYYSCGLRRNEGYSLNTYDINFESRVLHVRKGKNYKERFVPFTAQSSKYLELYLYDYRPQLLKDKCKEAFFISQRGKRMNAQSMALRLRTLITRTGIPELMAKQISLHTLRHSIATHLLAKGMALENISRFLGHSSLESTQIYTHLNTQDDENL